MQKAELMNRATRIWPRIASGLVMALFAGVVWGVVLAWIGYIATQMFGKNESVYENLQVTADGTPVIQTSANYIVSDQTWRTLDGQPYDPKQQNWLSPAYFQRPLRPPGLFETPIPWSQRVAALSDMLRPPAGWYLVRDGQPLGRGYFVGYDELSKLRIGYLGRKGFRRSLPPADEWFDLGRNTLSYSTGALAGTGYLTYGQHAYTYPQRSDNQRLPPWVAYLLDGDRLLEVDVRARSVRMLHESPGMEFVSVATEPRASNDADEENEPGGAAVAAQRRPDPLLWRVVLRMTDRFVVLDPPTGERCEFVLPEDLRSRDFYVYALAADQLLLHYFRDGWYQGPAQLNWLAPDGTITREETVVLGQPAQVSERESAWLAAGVAPVPIGWTAGIGLAAPLGFMQSNEVSTFGAGLHKALDVAWQPFVAVILLGLGLAWITYRQQRKYRRPATGAWVTFVLLLGLPGLFAYWLEQRRVKLETCTECGKVVPRDRESCAACEMRFPVPAPVGTEIFA